MGEPVGVFDVVLAFGVLGAAAFALFGRPRIHAAAMFLVFGVLLAVVWAWLAAPDVAITEAVLGAGVTGALIMNAVTASSPAGGQPPGEPAVSTVGAGGGDADVGRARSASTRPDSTRTTSGRNTSGGASGGASDRATSDRVRSRRTYSLFAGLFAAALAVGMITVVWRFRPVTGVGPLVEDNLAASGVSHPVTAVLLNFRSYDTLLEIAVLAAAGLAAFAIRPPAAPVPQHPRDRGPLGAMVRLLVPVLVLAVGWLLVAGSTRPGGAFQAGALLAGAALMLYLAGTSLLTRLSRWLLPILLAGLTAFLALAATTAAFTGGWLVLDAGWGGSVILALETVLMVSIGATLTMLLVTMDQISAASRQDAGESR